MGKRTASGWVGAGGLLATAIGLLFIGACRQAPAGSTRAELAPGGTLIVLTPHNAQIRTAFAQGFYDWCVAQGKPPVDIEWILRGTPQCVEYVNSLFTGAEGGRYGQIPDLMFGGGIADHAQLAAKGYSVAVKVDGAAGIPADVQGQPTHAPNGEWWATGLSSFGFVYNQHDCALRHIEPPASWADLADPRFQGWIGIASPESSGSHRQAMVFILDALGWENGWGTLLRILANSRGVQDSSSTVLDQVESGVTLATFAVNADGLSRSDGSDGRVIYVNPPAATAATPDVITILRRAKHETLAKEFVRYCLSEEGQKVWGVRADAIGRNTRTLYHYPIDPAIYTKYADVLAVKENPYQADFGLKVDTQAMEATAAALVPLVRAATGDNHILLQQAWAQAAGNAEATQALCVPPLTRDEALALGQAYAEGGAAERAVLLAEWSQKMHDRYQQVLDGAGK